LIETNKISYEKAILIGIINSVQSEIIVNEYLNELSFLTETAGGYVSKRFIQRVDKPNPKTFIGSGKIIEIQNYCIKNDIGSVIFDDELSPTQQLNLEKILRSKIIDRTGLILDIFAQRAKTSYAKNQVELAQYQYLMPRLKGLWTHLERQKGGIGMRGPGETEIETDRRIVRDKISLLKKRLSNIDKQMSVQRGNRGSLVRVALVGYTNVGKSTLMNLITKSDVFAENKLFATLDTTVRKMVIGNLPFLLTDTVGFIRKLPTQLVESFKSTLNEITESDLLLHIVDISHPNYEEHIDSVNEILGQIDSIDKPSILVFNKIDRLEDDSFIKSNKLKSRVYISAEKKTNINELKQKIYKYVRSIHVKRFPYNNFLYPEID
jgi:GTP-binding protein HflX